MNKITIFILWIIIFSLIVFLSFLVIVYFLLYNYIVFKNYALIQKKFKENKYKLYVYDEGERILTRKERFEIIRKLISDHKNNQILKNKKLSLFIVKTQKIIKKIIIFIAILFFLLIGLLFVLR